MEEVHFATEIGDELLRMLFVCCHPDLPVESRIALACALCAASVPEKLHAGC